MKLLDILYLSLLSTFIYGDDALTNGCSSSISKDDRNKGCSSKNILMEEKKAIFKIEEEHIIDKSFQTNISRELRVVNINHKGEEINIIRKVTDDKKSCPPYCIVPMQINGVKTVGELETLDFIKNLNRNTDSLILDIRENKDYNLGTIPGALNLPAHMLKEDSKYFKEVLSILGIKNVNGKWKNEGTHKLLIFDGGITDNKAFEAIKNLLKISYPSDKILYYRGGFSSWKSLGLTIYTK